jgi:hypothetical protein
MAATLLTTVVMTSMIGEHPLILTPLLILSFSCTFTEAYSKAMTLRLGILEDSFAKLSNKTQEKLHHMYRQLDSERNARKSHEMLMHQRFSVIQSDATDGDMRNSDRMDQLMEVQISDKRNMDRHLDNSIQQIQNHTNATVTSMVKTHLVPMNDSIKALEAHRKSTAEELSAFLNERRDLIGLILDLVSLSGVWIILLILAWLLLRISRALVRYLAQQAPPAIIHAAPAAMGDIPLVELPLA